MVRVTRAGLVVALLAIGSVAPDLARAQTSDGTDPGEAAPTDAPEADAPAADPAPGAASDPADPAASDDEPSADVASEGTASDGAATDQSGASGDTSQSADALGTSGAPAEETAAVDDEAVAEEQQAAREPLPWRNTFFTWTQGMTANSFFRDAQLSYNPLYYWSFNLAPRWYLDSSTFFFVSQSLFYEFTDDDGTSSFNHDVQLSDTIVELRRTIPFEGFIFIPGARIVLPASKLSQAQQRYFGAGVGLTAVRVIPEAWSLTIAAIGRYQYWFAGRNTAATQNPYADTAQVTVPSFYAVQPEGFSDAPMIDQASGSSSPRHQITAGLNITVTPVSGFTVSASLFWLSFEGHGLAPACYAAATSPDVQCLPDDGPTHWRHTTSLSLALAYDILPWFNLSVGYSNSTNLAPFFNDDGSVRSPFNPDANLTLSASFQVDGIYEALQGSEDDGLTPEQRQRRRQGLAQGRAAGGSM